MYMYPMYVCMVIACLLNNGLVYTKEPLFSYSFTVYVCR